MLEKPTIPMPLDPRLASLVNHIGKLLEEAKKLLEQKNRVVAVIHIRMADVGLEELMSALDDKQVTGSGTLVNQVWLFFEEVRILRDELLREPETREAKCKLHLD